MHYICVFFVFEAKYNNIYACHVTSWSRGPGIHTTYPSHISHPRRAIKVEILVELWYKNCNCDWIRIILSPENDCWFQDYLASRVYWTNHSLNISWLWECIHFFVCGIWQSFHRIKYAHYFDVYFVNHQLKYNEGPPWPWWSCGSWIYIYPCNRCPSPS